MPTSLWVSTLHGVLGGATPSNNGSRLTSRATKGSLRWDAFTVIIIVIIAGIWLLVCRLYLRDMICGMYGVLSKRLRPNGRSSVQRTRASSCKFFRDILSPTRSEPCLPTHYTSNGQSMQNSADALGTRDPISPIPAVHWPDRPHHWCQAGTGETTDGRHLPVAFDDPERTTHDVVFPHDNKAGLPKYGESDWTPPSSAEKWRSERPPPYVRNGQDTIDLQGGGDGLPHGTKADDAQYDQGHMLTLPPPTHPLSHD